MAPKQRLRHIPGTSHGHNRHIRRRPRSIHGDYISCLEILHALPDKSVNKRRHSMHTYLSKWTRNPYGTVHLSFSCHVVQLMDGFGHLARMFPGNKMIYSGQNDCSEQIRFPKCCELLPQPVHILNRYQGVPVSVKHHDGHGQYDLDVPFAFRNSDIFFHKRLKLAGSARRINNSPCCAGRCDSTGRG
jgi:hypothetical protein